MRGGAGQPRRGGRVALDTPVQFLKGVGERRAELLRRLGIRTAGDLLYHVPHRYEDASTITPTKDVQPGMDVTVLGRVISKGVLPTRKGLRNFHAVAEAGSFTHAGELLNLSQSAVSRQIGAHDFIGWINEAVELSATLLLLNLFNPIVLTYSMTIPADF